MLQESQWSLKRVRFCFVAFASHADQQLALGLDGKSFDDREISVQVAKTSTKDPVPEGKVDKANKNNSINVGGNDNHVEVAAQTRPLFKIIEDEESCGRACAALSESTCVALYCKGVYLGRAGGRHRLVQVASRSAGIFLFDVVKCPTLFDAGLRDLCQSSRILKVIHGLQNVVALHEHGVNITPVYDSQVAYSILPMKNISINDTARK